MPPGGMAPPATGRLPDGVVLDLRVLASEVTEAHLADHPEDLERYGPAGREWCIHDNQHLLNWALLEVTNGVDFGAQVEWLAGVLRSRGYPVANLADNLQTAARTVSRSVDSVHANALADVLRDGCASIRGPRDGDDFVEERG